MSGMKDLLGDEPYPIAPGWRDPVTSRAAARSMANAAKTLRDRIMAELAIAPATVHAMASRLNCTVPAVQPRFSELLATNEIEWTGEMRANDSGRKAKVWKRISLGSQK